MQLTRWRSIQAGSLVLLALAVALLAWSIVHRFTATAVQNGLFAVVAVLLFFLGRAGARRGHVPPTLAWSTLAAITAALVWSAVIAVR